MIQYQLEKNLRRAAVALPFPKTAKSSLQNEFPTVVKNGRDLSATVS